ncbi:MAG: tail protein X [Hyphomicrobium sp.]
MATIYVTKQGDMIDLICFRHYGGHRPGSVEAVLEANRTTVRLAHRDEVLPLGLALTLPDLPKAVTQFPIQNLWD